MNDATLETSVIVCAYTEKRWDILVQAIESLVRQEPPPDEIIIVIDHNPALFARTQARFPEQVVIENTQTQGLSGARNTGVEASRGRYIAFLDDDAVADPRWLATLVDRCKAPQALGAGSKIDPLWMEPAPRWFPPEFNWIIGCSYQGMPTTTTPVRNPFGCSMCIRREVFATVGNFQIGIGRVGTIPLGCEETELCIRARQHFTGATFVYEPSVAVHHQVTPNRTTWSYFFRRCYAEGLSKYLISQLVGAKDGLESERGYVLRTLPAGIWRGLRRALFRLDLSGLASAFAIVAGVGVTGIGFLIGRFVIKPSQIPQTKNAQSAARVLVV